MTPTRSLNRPALHGTRSRYNAGCHCAECNGANNAYRREMYRRSRGGSVRTYRRRWAS